MRSTVLKKFSMPQHVAKPSNKARWAQDLRRLVPLSLSPQKSHPPDSLEAFE
jgi:hypothetical protein